MQRITFQNVNSTSASTSLGQYAWLFTHKQNRLPPCLVGIQHGKVQLAYAGIRVDRFPVDFQSTEGLNLSKFCHVLLCLPRFHAQTDGEEEGNEWTWDEDELSKERGWGGYCPSGKNGALLARRGECPGERHSSTEANGIFLKFGFWKRMGCSNFELVVGWTRVISVRSACA
jgi:hypothetical protein